MLDQSLQKSASQINRSPSSSSDEEPAHVSALTPRDYQLEALQFAKSRNSIIFLDTGAGKTLIAILLIQRLFSPSWKIKRERKKLCIFLVTTVNLVDQQAEAIKKHSNVSVKTLHGDQSGQARFDQACAQNWRQYISSADVLVSIAQKFLFLLRHGFLTIEDIDLLIFDECHHCASNHPYALIMTQFYHRAQEKPRILGLTASPVKGKVNRAHTHQIMQSETFHIMRSLSRLLDAEYSPLTTYEKVARNLPSPELILFDSQADPHDTALSNLLDKILPSFFTYVLNEFDYSKIEEKFGYKTKQKAFEAFKAEFFSFYTNCLASVGLQTKTFRDHSRNSNLRLDFLPEDDQVVLVFLLVLIKKSMPLLKELGVGAFILFSQELLENFKKQASYVCSHLEEYLKDAILVFRKVQQRKSLYNSKVGTLLSLLLQLNSSSYEQSSSFRGLVFVSERICGYYLATIIQRDDNCKHAQIHPRFVSGSNAPGLFSAITKGDLDDIEGIVKIRDRLAGSTIARVILKEQRKIISDFQKAECNLLIATSVVEEGLDVQACNVAICFNFFSSVKSYIQMRGRARKDDSKFLLLAPEDRKAEYLREIKESQECVKLMREYSERGQFQKESNPVSITLPDDTYLELPSKALMTLASAPEVVKQYCIDRAQAVQLSPKEPVVKVFERELAGKIVGFLAALTMPSFCNEHVQTKKLSSTELCSSKEEAKNKLYYKVALILLEKGELSPHLFWTNRPIRKNKNQRKLNYKGAEFYLRARVPTLGLTPPNARSDYYFYIIEPASAYPFRNANRTLGLALSSSLQKKVGIVKHHITRKALKRLDIIKEYARNLSTGERFQLSSQGVRMIEKYKTTSRESLECPIELKQFHKMSLNQKTKDLLHFFQTYLFYSLIGANLQFYKLIVTEIVMKKESYLTRIFSPILSLKNAKTFLKRLNFEENINSDGIEPMNQEMSLFIVPLRREKKFMKIDYGLIKQIYRIVIQDLLVCGFHLNLDSIPPDSELHGFIVENLLNYQKYYADCTNVVNAGDSMNSLSYSQTQSSVETYTQYYNSKYFLYIPESEELTQCTFLPVLGNDADIRFFPLPQDEQGRQLSESKILKHKVALPKRVLRVIPLDASLIEKANALPAILYRLERTILLSQLHTVLFEKVHYSLSLKNNLFSEQERHSKIELTFDQLQECLTCRNMNQIVDYERLQFLGDTVLKLIATADLVLHQGNEGEGVLSRKRAENYVSNLKLMEIANALSLHGFIEMFPVQLKKIFTPPGFSRKEY